MWAKLGLACTVAAWTLTATGYAQEDVKARYTEELGEVNEDLTTSEDIHYLESARTDNDDARDDMRFVIRSRHFIFGMPRLADSRYRLSPKRAGVSVLVREGFALAYLEGMRCPLWVCQRWTDDELTEDKGRIPSLKRDWRKDPELPLDTRIGTSYAGDDTGLDRGHMAKHSMNRAWGLDASIRGCLMSNSVPQHKNINRGPGGAWGRLEEEVENIVDSEEQGIDVVWTISGALFRDTNNPEDEEAAADFAKLGTITSGFKVPFATYKIVCWFEDNGFFHARGYVFEQPYKVDDEGKLSFTLPAQDKPLAKYIVKIDRIEERAGVDFFPMLTDRIEDLIEGKQYTTMWDRD